MSLIGGSGLMSQSHHYLNGGSCISLPYHSISSTETLQKHSSPTEITSGCITSGVEATLVREKSVSEPKCIQEVDNGLVCKDGSLPKPTTVLCNPDSIRMEWDRRYHYIPEPVGLLNAGNTCFLNSVLQCLTFTAPLANYFLNGGHKRDQFCVDHCIMCRMQSHVKMCFTTTQRVLRPNQILERLQMIARHMERGRQEDAHEFLRCLTEAMQKRLLLAYKNLDRFSRETTLLNQIFGGYLRSQVVCGVCHSVSNTYEPFLDISLDVKDVYSVDDAMKAFFRVELLDNDNLYNCEKCCCKVKAQKSFSIHQAPRVLTIQLKRYSAHSNIKLNNRTSFPSLLNIQRYLSATVDGTPTNCSYDLYGILVHCGMTTTSGHYYCCAKSSNRKWYKLNDGSITEITMSDVLREEAYLLFYIQNTNKPMPNPKILTSSSSAVINGRSSIAASTTKHTATLANGTSISSANSKLVTATGIPVSRPQLVTVTAVASLNGTASKLVPAKMTTAVNGSASVTQPISLHRPVVTIYSSRCINAASSLYNGHNKNTQTVAVCQSSRVSSTVSTTSNPSSSGNHVLNSSDQRCKISFNLKPPGNLLNRPGIVVAASISTQGKQAAVNRPIVTVSTGISSANVLTGSSVQTSLNKPFVASVQSVAKPTNQSSSVLFKTANGGCNLNNLDPVPGQLPVAGSGKLVPYDENGSDDSDSETSNNFCVKDVLDHDATNGLNSKLVQNGVNGHCDEQGSQSAENSTQSAKTVLDNIAPSVVTAHESKVEINGCSYSNAVSAEPSKDQESSTVGTESSSAAHGSRYVQATNSGNLRLEALVVSNCEAAEVNSNGSVHGVPNNLSIKTRDSAKDSVELNTSNTAAKLMDVKMSTRALESCVNNSPLANGIVASCETNSLRFTDIHCDITEPSVNKSVDVLSDCRVLNETTADKSKSVASRVGNGCTANDRNVDVMKMAKVESVDFECNVFSIEQNTTNGCLASKRKNEIELCCNKRLRSEVGKRRRRSTSSASSTSSSSSSASESSSNSTSSNDGDSSSSSSSSESHSDVEYVWVEKTAIVGDAKCERSSQDRTSKHKSRSPFHSTESRHRSVATAAQSQNGSHRSSKKLSPQRELHPPGGLTTHSSRSADKGENKTSWASVNHGERSPRLSRSIRKQYSNGSTSTTVPYKNCDSKHSSDKKHYSSRHTGGDSRSVDHPKRRSGSVRRRLPQR